MRPQSIATVVAFALVVDLSAQTLSPPPRHVIGEQRTLTTPEIAAVLDAVRHALDGKRFKLAAAPEMAGPEVVMGADGRPLWVRGHHGEDGPAGHVDVITIREFTRSPARVCNGDRPRGELVIEYELRGTTDSWTARSHVRDDHEPLLPLFDLLSGEVPASSGELKQLAGRPVRAFTGPYRLPPNTGGSDALAHATNVVWIDRETLLPLRASVVLPAGSGANAQPEIDYGLWFISDPTIDIERPEGVAAPDCVR